MQHARLPRQPLHLRHPRDEDGKEGGYHQSQGRGQRRMRLRGCDVAAATDGGSGFFDSPALAVALQPGVYYWLGAYWDQPVTYYYSNSQPGAPLVFDFGFGTMTYHARRGAYTTLPGPPSFAGGGSISAPYRFAYNLRLIENASLGEGSNESFVDAASKGNAVTVSSPMTLESIELYLQGVPAGTNLYWAVYQSETLDGVYQKVWEATRTVIGGSGYFASPPAMVALEPGPYYWLGGYWDQPSTYFYSNSQPGAPQTFDVGFGSVTYEWRDGEPFNTIPGPPTFVGTGSTNAPYQQRYVIRPAGIATPGEGVDASSTNSSSSKGNVVTVTQPQTLDSIGLYLTDDVDGTDLWWAVYESDELYGTYTKIWESSRTVSASDGYFYSGPVVIDLEPGRYYWLGGFWNLPVTYYYSNSMPGAPQTFPFADGGLFYHERLGAYSTLPGPTTFVNAGGSVNSPYWQRYVAYGHRLSVFSDGFETGATDVWSSTVP